MGRSARHRRRPPSWHYRTSIGRNDRRSERGTERHARTSWRAMILKCVGAGTLFCDGKVEYLIKGTSYCKACANVAKK